MAVIAIDLGATGCKAAVFDGADMVVHLAAQVGVGQSMYEIDEYVGSNDHGTAVLLQALQTGGERAAGDTEADGELVCPEASAGVEVEEGVVLRRERGGRGPDHLAVPGWRRERKRRILDDGVPAGEDRVEGRPVKGRVEQGPR